jgi:phosphate acetyltransferase
MTKISFQSLIEKAQQFAPIKTAVVHPITQEALEGVVAAAKRAIIDPILVGPMHKIKAVAVEFSIDISDYKIINTVHSQDSAAQAIALVRAGEVAMLMKGSLHTDELMQAVVNKEKGLRTAKRMSHVFIASVSTYHKLLLLTDCALNIWPELCQKRDIIQNAIELAQVIGIPTPKVAILSAIETINDKLLSTIDAAALCKMADRGQIMGGQLEGPLALDNAISTAAAQTKNIVSSVAGNADILLAPNLEAGNILAKQMNYFAGGTLAGIVLGARVPIIVTSRADNAEARLVSCAIGRIYAHASQARIAA